MSFPAETAHHHHRAWTITTSFGLLQHQRHQQQYQQQQQQQQHLSLFKCYSSKTNSDAAAAGATNDTPKSSTVRKTYATGSIDSNGVVSIHKSDGGSDGSGDGNNRRRRKHSGNSGGGGGRGGGGRRGQQQQRRPSRRRNNRDPPPPLLPSISSGGDPTNNDTRGGCYRSVLLPGTEVDIIKKEHQRTKSPQITTHGFIERSLGRSSYHPRGIKVVLQGSGAIGRVCKVFE